jgi:hypothetical protein
MGREKDTTKGRKDNLEKSERSAMKKVVGDKKLVGEKRTWERKAKVAKTGMCEETYGAEPKKRDAKSKFPSYLLTVNLGFKKGGDPSKKPYKKREAGKGKGKGEEEAP